MDKTEIFNAVVDAFEGKYNWLGRQFGEEFMYSVASYNLQKYMIFDARVRNHLLLFWAAGWLKSSLIRKAFDILGADLCAFINDITEAALRGSVEYTSDGEASYTPPFVKEKPFIAASEIGSLTYRYRRDGLVQELLTILEEGFNSTQLIKFARLSAEQKKAAEETYDIKFVGTCRVMFVTNCVWFAATYNPEYVVDNAFASRWEIMKPAKELGSDLTKWINRHHWHLDKEVIEALRGLVDTRPDPNLKAFYYEHLPDELYEKHIRVSPRATRSLKVYKLCRAFWGLETSDSMLMDRFRSLVESQEAVSEGWADKIINYLKRHGPSTHTDIMKGIDIPSATLYNVLKHMDISRQKKGDTTYYGVSK